MKIKLPYVLALVAVALVAGCASETKRSDVDADFQAMLKSSFHDQGIAKMDRLNQDLAQAACSSDQPPSAETARRIEAEALASVKWPSDGRYFGDWKAADKLAQSGRGMTWSDKSADPENNGGQCYNCHQLDKKEISFGTIGPSLYNYGKLRGVKSLDDPAAQQVIKYTWVKLWNSKAYSACSNMPRFGHMHLLNEQELRDMMALLLDPRSLVNN